MVGYTKREEEKKKTNLKNDELLNKIRELEKQVFEQKEADEIKGKGPETNLSVTKKSSNLNYLYIGLLVLGSAFILYKIFKKNK